VIKKILCAAVLLFSAFSLAAECANGGAFSITVTVLAVGPPEVTGIVLRDRTSGSTLYTNERTVNVEALGVTGNSSQMILSENSDFSGASWVDYENPTAFELSPEEGIKTVYYRLRDNLMNESSVVSSSITLDSTAPKVGIKVAGVSLKGGDHVDRDTTFEITLTDNINLDAASISLIFDGSPASYTVISQSETSIQLEYEVTDLAEGTHSIKAEVKDAAGNLGEKEITDLKVTHGPAEVIGPVLSYPTPFSPPRDKVCKLVYNLSRSAEVKIVMYGPTGVVWTRVYSAGENGGRAGYNEVDFTGISDVSNMILSKHIYLYQILIDGQLKAKGRVVII